MGGGGQLISVYPEELTFEFELDKPSYCNLKVVNNTEHHVAFKVKTTSPKKYFVRPNTSVVQPWDSCTVTVTLQAQKEFPPDMQSKDKFLLQSTRVPPNTDMDELPPDTFNKDGDKVIEELKLRVVYMAPSQSGRGNSEGDLGFTSRSLKHGSDDLSMLKNSSIEEGIQVPLSWDCARKIEENWKVLYLDFNCSMLVCIHAALQDPNSSASEGGKRHRSSTESTVTT